MNTSVWAGERAGQAGAERGLSPAPYERIKRYVVERIADGTWKPGDAIPSETVFAREFGVARMTVNRALRELSAGRILTRVQGAGTFVTPRDHESPVLEIRNIADEVALRGHAYSARVLALDIPDLRAQAERPDPPISLHRYRRTVLADLATHLGGRRDRHHGPPLALGLALSSCRQGVNARPDSISPSNGLRTLHRIHHQRLAIGRLRAAHVRRSHARTQGRQIVGHAGHQFLAKPVEHRLVIAQTFQASARLPLARQRNVMALGVGPYR